MRRCGRRFVLLAGGGVRIAWDCGASKVCPDETAVDVEYLADHLADVVHHHRHHVVHHHRHHLTHKEGNG